MNLIIAIISLLQQSLLNNNLSKIQSHLIKEYNINIKNIYIEIYLQIVNIDIIYYKITYDNFIYTGNINCNTKITLQFN